MIEKLTPTRFAQVKAISGTNAKGPYSFNSVGFQTREQGERWYNFAFKGDNPLKEGQTYEFDIKERPYKAKDGSDKVAYDAKKPDPLAALSKAIFDLSVRVGKIDERVKTLESPKATPAQMSEPPDDFDAVNAENAGRESIINEADLPF